jgi:hypothetical protein
VEPDRIVEHPEAADVGISGVRPRCCRERAGDDEPEASGDQDEPGAPKLAGKREPRSAFLECTHLED